MPEASHINWPASFAARRATFVSQRFERMTEDPKSVRWVLPGLGIALVLWGIVVAVGAYLGGVRFGYNPGRGLVVAGAVLAFLALWGALLYVRGGRRGR